ncbi:hypothetical protein QL285_087716 [Trifolium repens]|nr:hypothetical protein QL285_087716 [Trifolium repens]
MPPRRAPARGDDDVDIHQMAYAMNTMAAAVTAQTHAKAQRDLEKRDREILAARSRVLASFNQQAPPKFNGEGGPETADLWLHAMERIFGAIHCPEGEKVVLATYQLLGGSEFWWRNTRLIMENAYEEINWENFKRRFLAKYFPETARERYGEEFLRLRQGSMNVEAYSKKFESLSRFFRFFRDGIDEVYMCRRFQDGLRYELQDAVVPLGIRQFQVLVEKCQEVEDMRNKRVNRQGGFSAGGPSRSGGPNQSQNRGKQGSKPYDRPQYNKGQGRSVNQNSQNTGKQGCFKCGEVGHYANECRNQGHVCFNCKKPGHFARDCKAPKAGPSANVAQGSQGTRPAAKARAYCMGTEVSGQASNAIHESCHIAGNSLTALIDTGATHSFISLACANWLSLNVSVLPFDLNVLTPAKDLVVNTACLHCLVVIQNREFLVNLVCLPLTSLEIILGMDWLSYHYVILDCARKLVFFPEPGVRRYLKSVSVCSAQMASQQELLKEFRDLHLEVEFALGNMRLGMITISNGLLEDIANCQGDEFLMGKRALIVRETNRDFKVGPDNILRCNGRVCVPDAMNLRNTILGEAHKSKLSMHPGATKMYQDLRQDFWWPGMKRDVAEFVASCLTCQKAKIEHQRPAGILQSLDIPEWKWDSISMDFITGLPKTRRKHDSIWVIVDRLTKSAHFLPVRITDTAAKLTDVYIAEIVRLHGIPSSIVSDRDPKFTSHFWKTLHEALGTKLRLSSAYHPQTDGQTERTNQSLEDLLRACVLDDRGSWDDVLPLIEFTYNNSYHSTIGMAPYEALYGRRCQTPLCWYQDGESLIVGPEMVQQTTDKVRKIRAMMKVAQDRQKSYADRRRRPLEFEEGDHVFLRVTPTTGVGRALKAKKLTPKFIGPYQILERVGKVAYRIALPPVLSLIHDVFHVSQLRKYTPDPSHVITPDDIQLRDNLSFEVPPIKIADRKMKRLRTKEIPLVKVIWNEATGDTTWELESKMKELYPGLFDDV